MKQYKQLDNSTLENVATTETPYAPYKRPSEISAVIAAIMSKVHTIGEDIEQMMEDVTAARNNNVIMQKRVDALETALVAHTRSTHAEPDLRGMY